MKLILVLLLSCSIAFSENIADLKKQLAAAKQELAAHEAHDKLLQNDTRKLKEAAETQTATGKENTKKIEAATDKIIESEATGKKLVETVKSEAAATKSATAQLANEVKTTGTAVTSAIAAQARQQEKALAAAREVARKLEQSNRELAEANAKDQVAKLAARATVNEMSERVIELTQKADIAAAKNENALKVAQLQLIGNAISTGAAPLCGVLFAIVVVFQIRATKAANETHKLVNGQRAAMVGEIEQLKAANQHLKSQLTHRST